MIRNPIPYAANVPEEKLKPLRMEHFYLRMLILFCYSDHFVLVFSALLILGAGTVVSSLAFLLEKFISKNKLFAHFTIHGIAMC